jgi:hypothetical protein
VELVRLAARLIIEEALEGEARDALGHLNLFSSKLRTSPASVAAIPGGVKLRASPRNL